MKLLYKCLNIGLSLLPDACLACGTSRERRHGLCVDCHDRLRRPRGSCPRCAIEGTTGRLCGRCQSRPPAFDRCVAALRYEGLARELVHRYKYRADLSLARPLGRELADAVSRRETDFSPDLIIPVPLHYTRLMSRGYNQSMALARAAGRITGVRVAADTVTRSRRTGHQQRLPAESRRCNLRDAFRVTRPLPRRIALVDDVMTTGETLDSLARTLRAAGVAEIECWVLARA